MIANIPSPGIASLATLSRVEREQPLIAFASLGTSPEGRRNSSSLREDRRAEGLAEEGVST